MMTRAGFSLVEVMVALVILTVGVLAMATTTGWVGLQVHAADVRTERNVAYQQVIESLRALNYDSVKDRAYSSAETIGAFKVWWEVDSLAWGLANVELYTEGPGWANGVRSTTARDTISVRIARPYP